MTETDYISLKWGTLKAWRLTKPESFALLERYTALGMSLSAMAQKDTNEQKQVLCELIQQHDGPITNDWSGENYTKDQAVEYVTTYGTKP